MKFTLTALIILMIQINTATATTTVAAKKNFCSMTINSNEEVNLFKKYLSQDQWNYVELTPDQNQPENQNWFKLACEKKVNCDILVISGHFGGTFFGSATKSKLSTEELEAGSCESSCNGITHHPKEVFLLGCNTLASKTKDHRSPEEYMRVLQNDGFSHAQASQIVSFRYSGFGDSFQSRMSNIFATVPKIYGFTTVGPSGKTIYSMLKNYLESSQKYYSNVNFENQNNSTQKNEKLFTALKNTSLAQISGSLLEMKTVEEKPYCYIRSQRVSRLDKIKYIETLFTKGNAISMLSHIEWFLLELRKLQLTTAEKNILKDLGQNEKIKSDLLNLLDLKWDIYIPLKANVLNTLKELKIVSNEFIEKSFNSLIDLKSPFTDTRRDMICSSDIKTNIPAFVIPNERWKENNFITTLLCLKMKEPEIQFKISELLDDNYSSSNMKATAIWYFHYTKTQDEVIQNKIANILLNDKDEQVRLSAILVLVTLKPTAQTTQMLLARSFLNETSETVLLHTIKFFKEEKINTDVLNFLKSNKTNSKNYNVINQALSRF